MPPNQHINTPHDQLLYSSTMTGNVIAMLCLYLYLRLRLRRKLASNILSISSSL